MTKLLMKDFAWWAPTQMSVFVGAAAATLFPSSSVPYQSEEVIDTAGSQIETQLMELIDEHQSHRSSSPTSFIDTEFEETLNGLMIRNWRTAIR